MHLRSFLPLFVAVMLAGWFVPDLLGGFSAGSGMPPASHGELSGSAPAMTDPSETAREDADDEDGWLASEIALEREGDGHFYADVDVNGQSINFLVDTGATAVALTASDAEALGLYWDESELQTVGRGVSGDVRGKLVMLDHMQIGSLAVSNIPAAIIPHGLDRSLLGQAFLKKIDNVNISGDRMVLK